ncbi:hypothetical protein GCM10007415_39500 [Parapedobacter pyrenivorans]|uniref:Glyoxalase-like domain-containing protein n=1 Tax=Parapedobacter pyrenivorans TaxID=1305674 RepID=A0A917MEQ1_9SPHI|nr:hypothetical protein [Parapedobacter pyrenivorans]GGG99751.1 hypothetical protein GCM10007415_39500 [Parapedobacter pyrenivorans]
MTDKTHSKTWTTVPSLPCVAIEETLSFWEMLGFEITYKQTRPYQYGVVARGGSELHFGRVKGMEASGNEYNGCLVVVPSIEAVYQEFTATFKEKLGRIPHTGIPRISRMKPGTTRFTLTDVSGNSMIFIDSDSGEEDQNTWEKADDKNQSPLQKAIAMAIRFRDYKEDEQAAAKTLDVALRKAENEENTTLAEALAVRMDLAVFMGNRVRADECNKLLSQLGLSQVDVDRLMQKHGTER